MPIAKEKITPYQRFIATELVKARKAHPDWSNKEYMKLTALKWKAHKLENGIESESDDD